MNLQTLKGFRDFLPQEARKRQYVIDVLKKTFESFGFEPLETPALEYEEVLAGKYGEESQKLMYRFKDAGDRDVAMRYDQTVPLARVVAQYANSLPLPFKRYQIQPVWRAENPQKGRFREFLQADIDIVGSSSPLSDAEIIQVVLKGYESLGFKNITVLINDRSVFEGIDPKAISVIDKLKKIGEGEVKKELVSKGFDPSLLDQIQNAKQTESIKNCSNILEKIGIANIKFEPTLARGLDYYTGLIFEIEAEGYSGGSVGGGGRYDNLIGVFAGKSIPAVGFSFGFDRTLEAMDELGLFPTDLTTLKVLVTVPSVETIGKSLETANKLRSSDINVEVYPDANVGTDKQLKYADKKGIPFVVLFEDGQTVLKDMKSGEKSESSAEEIRKKLA